MLLYQFNKGDERAFKKLFDDFFKSSCAFVKRYIPDHGAVEDVVQETFINLWEKRGIYTDMVYFKAYLYKSLYNNALFYLRQHKISEDVDPGIDRLPSERRRIVELSMAGHTQEEIAEKLKISVNTVKTQKRKAFAFLRAELQHLFVFFLVLLHL